MARGLAQARDHGRWAYMLANTKMVFPRDRARHAEQMRIKQRIRTSGVHAPNVKAIDADTLRVQFSLSRCPPTGLNGGVVVRAVRRRVR